MYTNILCPYRYDSFLSLITSLLNHKEAIMKNLLLSSTLIITSLITYTLNAAVFIEVSDSKSQKTKIYIEGKKARIEIPENEGYVVVDTENQTMKAVMHNQRTIWDMSDFLKNSQTQSAPKKHVDTYMKTLGLGPTIVGYATEEYALYANDKYCGSIYVSVNAMRDMGVKKFAYTLANMERNIQEKFSSMTGVNIDNFLAPCDEATRKASLKLRDIGFLLKSSDKNKQMQTIVTRVNKKASLPINAFSLPSDYKVTNPSKLINEALKHLTPDMRRMIEQQMRQ